ncbi:hypothetical protein [Paraburkholderia caledonica]|uniref:Uncharacterized protein n=1 Tax=Paraburkholderia caledonica TaxID=134536 RepID=A0AB73IVF1_9BURK|nr:hypothetical protein [Paraburkholderia caledonica]
MRTVDAHGGATVVPERQVRFALDPKVDAFAGTVLFDLFNDGVILAGASVIGRSSALPLMFELLSDPAFVALLNHQGHVTMPQLLWNRLSGRDS